MTGVRDATALQKRPHRVGTEPGIPTELTVGQYCAVDMG
jgi:hypothetical protein